MKKSKLLVLILLIVACVGAGMVFARRYSGRRYYGRSRRDTFQRSVPNWTPNREFSHDIFTFVRIRYTSGYGRGFSGGNWTTDYPDSDLNFSFRLHQLTSMKVDPEGIVLELTNPELFNYPFIYIVEPGRLIFSEEEVKCLRSYLLNGGFLMVDDFWGKAEWDNFYYEIKRVFPDREPVEVPLDHQIFHAVFDLKEKPQIPSIDQAIRGRPYGITWEDHGPDSQTPHFRAIYDKNGRMMVFICHNTDLGDGWEREGEDEWFFHEFSEKKAYPLGINIVFYAMTH
jgi:hypothetical protein